MRVKEFIFFIIIFTILYFLILRIYDYYKGKKDIKEKEKRNLELINFDNYSKYAKFYNIVTTVNENTLKSIYLDIKDLDNYKISNLWNRYNLSLEEVIVIIEYFEFIKIINIKSINVENDEVLRPNENEELLLVRYYSFFSNKYDYKTIMQNKGLNGEKELETLIKSHLIPGIRIIDKTIYYLGDFDE